MDIPSIAVVIAAYNARDTIARAVQSALAQDEVAEVVVVDDASSDDTAGEAERAAEGDVRLRVLRQTGNGGPSAARNRAFAESAAPLLAILDADDIVLPGRFAHLLSFSDWDLIADDIVFCRDFAELDRPGIPKPAPGGPEVQTITTEQFIAGNIPERGRSRGELGFLKPLIRRSTVEELGARYWETCRLGEDFLFYAHMLARGARFRVAKRCGYGALVRANSLSGRHGLEDLRTFHAGASALRAEADLSPAEDAAMRRFLRALKGRADHREVLHIRNSAGLVPGIAAALSKPATIKAILDDWRGIGLTRRPTPHLLLGDGSRPTDG